MIRKLRPITLRQAQGVDRAVELLAEARDLLADAGCNRAAQRARQAHESAEGAKRHAQHRLVYTKEELRQKELV